MRDKFVAEFGEETASAIERAARSHENGVHDKPGSDYFRWAVCICIGAECFTCPKYAKYHGIERADEVKPWLLKNARQWLSAHDGDSDFLALFAGMYNEYMPPKGDA